MPHFLPSAIKPAPPMTPAPGEEEDNVEEEIQMQRRTVPTVDVACADGSRDGGRGVGSSGVGSGGVGSGHRMSAMERVEADLRI